MVPFAKFLVLVYPIGIPLLYLLLLYRDRKVLIDEDLRKDVLEGKARRRIRGESNVTKRIRRTAMLWENYDGRCWYWECVECVRRLMITGALVFVVPDSVSQGLSDSNCNQAFGRGYDMGSTRRCRR